MYVVYQADCPDTDAVKHEPTDCANSVSEVYQYSWIDSWSDEQIRHWQSQNSSICRVSNLKGSYVKQPSRQVVAGDYRNV